MSRRPMSSLVCLKRHYDVAKQTESTSVKVSHLCVRHQNIQNLVLCRHRKCREYVNISCLCKKEENTPSSFSALFLLCSPHFCSFILLASKLLISSRPQRTCKLALQLYTAGNVCFSLQRGTYRSSDIAFLEP